MIKSQFVTSEAVDVANCDREPIHLSGAVQPHGMLLAVDPASLRVIALSDNCSAFFGMPSSRVLHASLVELLASDDLEPLENALATADPRSFNPLRARLRPDQPEMDLIVHRSGETAILEFEPAVAGAVERSFRAAYTSIERAHSASDLSELLESVVAEVRASTGFDRVMIYRFDEDWHGQVVAESAVSGLTPYLHLHFPASDIPRQARELYTRNATRLIPDVSYTPAAIVPDRGPSTSAPLDLSGAVLRSVSPLHLEYLRNMGVAASMSISLICDGRLWGLIACHHRTPRYVPYAVRTAGELLARAASAKIVALQGRERYEARMHTVAVQSWLIEMMSVRSDLSAALVESDPNILQLFEAGGAAVRIGAGEPQLLGKTPPVADVMEIITWLQQRRSSDVFSSASLAALHEPFARFADVASGMLVLPISRSTGSYILWFRPEVVQSIDWGGDPNKPVEVAGGQRRLTPRTSFAAWRQLVERCSKPWQPFDEQAAADFGRAIGGYLLRQNDELVEVNRELARSNADLDAFAHMTSHDLKEPLRGIHNYASHILEDYTETLDGEVVEKLTGIIRLTQRMDELVASLLEFAGAGRGPSEQRDVDLGKVVLDAIEMLGARLDERSASVFIDAPLAHVVGDAAHLREVFVNLLSNAAKYNDKADRWVSVSMVNGPADDPANVTVAVADNGIGIEPDQYDTIFRMFKRMHARNAFGGGTGAGLAIVRKLLERMRGSIRVESVIGKGSTFFVSLPKA